MPTKSDRILSYLPGTFKRSPQKSALFAIVDAFGGELLQAENSLAALMQAHWVDHADKGAEIIDDLARIASLYGLAPRCREADDTAECALPPGCDETIEEFREHLKRYVRTFLEGTVTVQGIFRVTAEALALQIADDYEAMDTWWTPGKENLVTVVPRGDDAAQRLFGFRAALAVGQPARQAQVVSSVNLSGGVDLSETAVLHVQVDDIGPISIDLAKGISEPTAVTLQEIKTAIKQVLNNETIADHDGRFLSLTSTQSGADGFVTIYDGANDAAEKVLGLKPTVYVGSEAQSANVTSKVDLSDGANLQTEHFIRLMIDGSQTVEIDLPDGANVSLDQIQAAVNDALGSNIATNDGRFLALSSTTTGFNSSIAFQQPAAQNATKRIFGAVNTFHQGQNAQPAQVIGSVDLSSGADLHEQANIRFSLDGAEAITVNCVGQNPANTRPAEIATAINAAVGETVARQNGRFLTLSSLITGADGSLVFETPDEGDATELILGIKPRTFNGSEATVGHLVGQVDLSEQPDNLNLLAQHSLLLSVDGRVSVEIDLRTNSDDASAVTLNDLVVAINTAVDTNIASHDNKHLHLTSLTEGSASRLQVEPLETTQTRRFVTRAKIIDEAAKAIFGFVAKKAEGVPETAARVTGQKDLSRGVDLRDNQFLRLTVDNDTVDIDCAGARLRATLLEEIVANINDAFPKQVAFDNDKNLILQSTTTGADSQIIFEPPQATDARPLLLGVEPGLTRGQGAIGIRLVGIPDLSQGIDLTAGSSLRLAVDGATPINVVFVEEDATLTLNQLVLAINAAVKHNIASHDGTHLVLISLHTGAASQLEFIDSGETDVTGNLLGFAAPRIYFGAAAIPAQVIGQIDLGGLIDLRTIRFLRIGVDGETAVAVDCAANASDPQKVTLGEIITAINNQILPAFASQEGSHLILTSSTSSTASQIVLETQTAGDAREKLFGFVDDETFGDVPTPAQIKGDIDLLSPVDLSERSLLRLAIDGQRPIDIDVAGATPEATFLDEIVTAINSVQPGMAAQSDDDRLLLSSLSSGSDSQLEIRPLRYLELIEYPLQSKIQTIEKPLVHGKSLIINNKGAANSTARITFNNPRGVFGAALINKTLGWQLRLHTVLSAGETVHLWRDDHDQLTAVIETPQGNRRLVPGSDLTIGPLGTQTLVPTFKAWNLSGNGKQSASLQLNNPTAPHVVQLRAFKSGKEGLAIEVTVTESDVPTTSPDSVWEDGRNIRLIGHIKQAEEQWLLANENGVTIAHLTLGTKVDWAEFTDCLTVVTGTIHTGEVLLLVVQSVACLFDVTISRKLPDTEEKMESFKGVTIGVNPEAEDSLTWQINVNTETQSQLVTAVVLNKADVLRLPKGRSDWVYLDCLVARFNEANFDQALFPGNLCEEQGIFNISRFSNAPPEKVVPVFTSTEQQSSPATNVTFSWHIHQPAAFVVNLPADLPPRFGGRFNQARFGQGSKTQEKYAKAVAEPKHDENHLVNLIQKNEHSLVIAMLTDIVPLGWEAAAMPFRQAQFLTLGNDEQEARLYLSEEGLDGFIEIRAREQGDWGNKIAVSARPGGPAMYDVCIVYEGGVYENGRDAVRGQPPAALTQEMLEASPIGILQAKAAGVYADVTRSGAD